MSSSGSQRRRGKKTKNLSNHQTGKETRIVSTEEEKKKGRKVKYLIFNILKFLLNINIYTAKGGSGVSDNEPKKKLEKGKGEKKDGGKGGKKKLEKGKGTHDHGGNFF